MNTLNAKQDSGAPPLASVGSGITWTICFLLAHHLAVFVHEYAHSFTAFMLGYKTDPFQLQFGGTGILNLLLLSGVNEHVDYQNMVNHGDRWAVALVALAGPMLGNGLTYFVSLAYLNSEARKGHARRSLFAYAVNVMSVGNFFSYVPVRTFADHGDIAHITQSLLISPWTALVLLGTPTLFSMWWLFGRTMPTMLAQLESNSARRQYALVAVTILLVFGFFGLAGLVGYGRISHVLSCVSIFIAATALIFIRSRSFFRRRGAI